MKVVRSGEEVTLTERGRPVARIAAACHKALTHASLEASRSPGADDSTDTSRGARLLLMAIRWAYFDTSVLVKRYFREEGSLTAGDLMRRHRILSSAIAPVEALSAFSRRRAAAQLSDDDFRLVVARIRADRHHWELVGLTHTVLSRAEQVIGTAGVRTLDALHIACALVFQEMSAIRVAFVTADARQREAAQQMALDVTWLSTAS